VIPAALSVVGKALRWAAAQLAGATDRPHTEAERLLASVLLVDRPAILAHPEWLLTPTQADKFVDAIQRRASGSPLPYIIGHVAFYGAEFSVTPAVLIPRPETELLVELALARIQARGPIHVIDIGTGSGCIAVTLAREAPRSHVWATDVSTAALRIARENAARHGVAKRLTWVQADLLAPFTGPLDLIVSNPPYIGDAEWPDLPRSVQMEPQIALTSGPDGLDTIGRLLLQASTRLAPDGCLLMEIGERQASTVTALAQSALEQCGRQASLRMHQDLAGKDRVFQLTCGS
jgi:release factor glutamine methyltransferase